MQKSGYIVLLIFLFAGCQSSRSLKINSTQDINVRMAGFSELDEGGEKLGKVPLDIAGSKLKDKVLIFSNDTKDSQYWFFPDYDGKKKAEILITLKDDKCDKGKINLSQNQLCKDVQNIDNLLIKTTLAAYAALRDEEFSKAQILAEELLKLAPKTGGAHLLLGIIFFQKGNKTQARGMFEKARLLDPADPAVTEWLNSPAMQ